MTKLRIAFMGTPDFAVPALKSLAGVGHDIAAVYSQPPKPAGRGQQIRKSPVHIAAEELGIEVRTPKTLRDAGEQEKFAALKLDIAVVAAYGLILPLPVLNAPKFGCINIHASLLPRWRGAAPIQRSILAGDTVSGVTIMQMAEGLDTGDMLLHGSVPITNQTTGGALHDQLMAMGSHLIVPALEAIAAGAAKPEPQPEQGVTYAAKLSREDGRIDWAKPAQDTERQVRALQPWPGCFFMLNGEAIKVLAAECAAGSGASGTLIGDDFTIACGKDALRLVTVQRGGKNATGGADFLRGLRMPLGTKLDA